MAISTTWHDLDVRIVLEKLWMPKNSISDPAIVRQSSAPEYRVALQPWCMRSAPQCFRRTRGSETGPATILISGHLSNSRPNYVGNWSSDIAPGAVWIDRRCVWHTERRISYSGSNHNGNKFTSAKRSFRARPHRDRNGRLTGDQNGDRKTDQSPTPPQKPTEIRFGNAFQRQASFQS